MKVRKMRLLRHKHGITRSELGCACALSPQRISEIELSGTGLIPETKEKLQRGFESVVQKHPNWKILEQVDADFTTAKGKEEMQRLLKKYPSIDVVVSQNDDMTFGALEAIEEAGKTAGTGGEITVISFDSVSAALEKVKAGTIQADIECNPLLGPYIEEIIQELEQGRVPEKECYVEEKVFTQKNVLSVLGDRAY